MKHPKYRNGNGFLRFARTIKSQRIKIFVIRTYCKLSSFSAISMPNWNMPLFCFDLANSIGNSGEQYATLKMWYTITKFRQANRNRYEAYM